MKKKLCSSEMSIYSGSLSDKVSNTRSPSCDIKVVLSPEYPLANWNYLCLTLLGLALKMRICNYKNIRSMVMVPEL